MKSGGDRSPPPRGRYWPVFCFCFTVVSALEDCEAEPVADWLPVVVVELVSIDCVPEVLLASTLDDWLPVVVALSIVSDERPRRSMFGLNVDVEPVTDELTSVEAPDWLAVVEELEPETEGLAVAVPVALVFAFAACEALVEDVDSGTQSLCTALLECSAALPVVLLASLPAFLLPSSPQVGVEAVALLDVVVCAKAGAAPRIAAMARVLR